MKSVIFMKEINTCTLQNLEHKKSVFQIIPNTNDIKVIGWNKKTSIIVITNHQVTYYLYGSYFCVSTSWENATTSNLPHVLIFSTVEK